MKISSIPNIPIETNRLYLREFIEPDWFAIFEASSGEAMFFFSEPAFSADDAKTWVRNAIDSQLQNPRMKYEFAVELKSDSKVIGYCDLVIRAPVECEMAYSGFRYIPKYWGHGYGTEAETALLDFGFQQLNLKRISMICDTENIASWRIMEKCGMRREGHEVKAEWNVERKTYFDQFRYAILKEEWGKK